MLKKFLTITIITATLTVGSAAYAKDNHKHGNNGRWKNEYSRQDHRKVDHRKKKEHPRAISRDDRVIINNYYSSHYNYKKPRFNNYRVYSSGYRMPTHVRYSPLPYGLAKKLHHYHNTEYVMVDNNVYLLDIATRLILDVITLSSFR
jgi:Ni/Co efflux regulator RcnB